MCCLGVGTSSGSAKTMGCASSVYSNGRNKTKKKVHELAVFFPSLRIPLQSDHLHRRLRGLIPKDLAERISSLRNQIALVAEDTEGSAIAELQRATEWYLPLLLGLVRKEYGLQELVEFKWKNIEDGRQEVCISSSWFELLSVLHMMALLTMSEANSTLMPKDCSGTAARLVSADSMRDAVDLFLKAAGYLEFCIREVLIHLPTDIKNGLPRDLQECVLQAVSFQALGLGTEMQLGLAVESQNANLSVKRRLACEQVSYFGQAHHCLSESNDDDQYGKKHMLFIKWKYMESKAAAYYYHGLILEKGTEPTCHISAVCCLLAAEELITECKKACLSFCLAAPITRSPPPWGVMKHLSKKIPETASRKYQMYGYLLEQEKGLENLPDLPEFQLSLKPDDYELPEMDSAWDSEGWDIPGQSLKEHLKDSDDDGGEGIVQ